MSATVIMPWLAAQKRQFSRNLEWLLTGTWCLEKRMFDSIRTYGIRTQRFAEPKEITRRELSLQGIVWKEMEFLLPSELPPGARGRNHFLLISRSFNLLTRGSPVIPAASALFLFLLLVSSSA